MKGIQYMKACLYLLIEEDNRKSIWGTIPLKLLSILTSLPYFKALGLIILESNNILKTFKNTKLRIGLKSRTFVECLSRPQKRPSRPP